MTDIQLVYGYKLTNDASFRDKENSMTPELKNRMEELFYMANEGKQSDIPTFLDLIEKYPNNPQIKNYLSVLYKSLNRWDKCTEMNHWIVKEHPDYLFGKLNLASEYIKNEDYERVPEVLGKSLELKDLYPDRDIFHVAELTGYLKIVVHYLSSIGDFDQAMDRLNILEDIAPDHPDTEYAHMFIQDKLLPHDNFEDSYTAPADIDVEQTTDAPVFNHPEINALYKHSLDIPVEALAEICNLPRKTLIKDLEEVLHDSLRRYLYYTEKYWNDEMHEEEPSFAIHAFLLLGDLESAESLPLMLKILSQDADFLDFWYQGLLTECLWEPLLKTGISQLDTFKEFMGKPGIYTFSKSEISVAVSQLALHFPERRGEVIHWFKDILESFIACEPNNPLINEELIALIIGDLTDIQLTELLPEIEELFKLNYVDTITVGTFREVKKDMTTMLPYDPVKTIMSVEERYQEIISLFTPSHRDADNGMDDGFLTDNENWDTPQLPIVNDGPKTGRNDPCPCGSGKKYKKCCLNK